MRKVVHVLLSTVLLLPYLVDLSKYGLTPLLYYSLAATGASLVYAAQIRRPMLTQALLDALLNARQVFFQQLEKYPRNVKEQVDALNEGLNKLEVSIREFVNSVERDYERRGGYLGMLMGAIGVLLADILAGNYVVYGVLSVMVYDTMSAVGGVALGRVRIPFTNSTLEGTLVGMACLALLLFLLTGALGSALFIPATAAVTEMIGIEDNLSIPLTTSIVAMALRLPGF